MASSTVEVAVPHRNAEEIETDQPKSREESKFDQFANWFPRCRNTLHFVACLILGGSAMAGDAVQRCRAKAAQNLRSFESEGFFRGWIMRILIHEALSILYGNHTKATEANALEFRKQ
jgi:DNA-directed RNA polymerase specialized sigma24 family protein